MRNWRKRAAEGLGDTGDLEWCFATGRKPTEEETLIWNEFMHKRGWNDEATEILNRRNWESGLSDPMISAPYSSILTRTREGLL